MNEIIKDMFDSSGWVKYNKTIARVLGANAAIILGNLIDKQIYWEDRGYSEFFHLREDIEYETGLSPHEQRTGEKKLIQHGLITITPKGLPKKNYFTIDFEAIELFLQIHKKALKSSDVKKVNDLELKKLTTCDVKSERLEVKKVNGNKNKENKNKEIRTNNNMDYYESTGNTTLHTDLVKKYSSKYEEIYGSKYPIDKSLFKKLAYIDVDILQYLYDHIDDWFSFLQSNENAFVQESNKSIHIALSPNVYQSFIQYVNRPKKKMAWDL